jgi:hypothetical protein
MVFEGAKEDFEQFEGLTAEEVEARLREFDNILSNPEEVSARNGKKDGPNFWIDRIPPGYAATCDFDPERIRIWENSDGSIDSIGVG